MCSYKWLENSDQCYRPYMTILLRIYRSANVWVSSPDCQCSMPTVTYGWRESILVVTPWEDIHCGRLPQDSFLTCVFLLQWKGQRRGKLRSFASVLLTFSVAYHNWLKFEEVPRLQFVSEETDSGLEDYASNTPKVNPTSPCFLLGADVM